MRRDSRQQIFNKMRHPRFVFLKQHQLNLTRLHHPLIVVLKPTAVFYDLFTHDNLLTFNSLHNVADGRERSVLQMPSMTELSVPQPAVRPVGDGAAVQRPGGDRHPGGRRGDDGDHHAGPHLLRLRGDPVGSPLRSHSNRGGGRVLRGLLQVR